MVTCTADRYHTRYCCCAAAVMLVLCWCGVPVVVSMVVVLLLSRLCEDEALSRTQQVWYAVVGVFVILCCGCWVACTADRYHTRYSIGSGDM